jgi:hypothetical protein
MKCRIALTKPLLELYLFISPEMVETQILLPLYQLTNQISTELDALLTKRNTAEIDLCAVPECSFVF